MSSSPTPATSQANAETSDVKVSPLAADAAFVIAMEDFLVQAIVGPVVALRRLPAHLPFPRNRQAATIAYVKYLNECWHSYHQKTDEFVVNAINKILAPNRINGATCLWHWFLRLGQMQLAKLDFAMLYASTEPLNMTALNFYRSIVRAAVQHHLKAILLVLAPTVRCGGDEACPANPPYRASDDIFKFSTSAHDVPLGSKDLGTV
jgi:hypothetical protein